MIARRARTVYPKGDGRQRLSAAFASRRVPRWSCSRRRFTNGDGTTGLRPGAILRECRKGSGVCGATPAADRMTSFEWNDQNGPATELKARHHCHRAAGTRQVDRSSIHGHVHTSQGRRGVEDHKQGLLPASVRMGDTPAPSLCCDQGAIVCVATGSIVPAADWHSVRTRHLQEEIGGG